MSRHSPPFLTSSVLPCGTHVLVRPIRRDDAPWLARGLQRLSANNRIRRFFFDKAAYSDAELRRLTSVDDSRHIAVVLAILDAQGREIDIVAVARCFRDAVDPALAEIAVTTVDEWQRKGVGTLLIGSLARWAWAVGIRRWQAVFFTANAAPLKLLDTVAKKESMRYIGDGVSEAIYHLHPPENHPPE